MTCDEMKNKEGEILVFINYLQAARFGHVAWGIRVAENEYFFGSTDHLWKHDWWDLPAWARYMNVPPEGDIDWWVEHGSKDAMLKMMRSGHHIRYHAYKCINVQSAQPEKAVEAAHRLRSAGWHLARHNCVHQTFLVMNEYSSEHNAPDPFANVLNLIPKRWFGLLPGDTVSL
ncbi:MAG: hypothetical protein K2X77_15090 [Candidatus Obscuribacterales bacterium]|jgi:hypothetical protein|nr:hypothetical protein [Candidatus Obscuribacterales bacterium]